jgi:hypothetical protein
MKTWLSLFFWCTTFAALIIMFMSAGWLLITVGLVLIGVIILHIISVTRTLNRALFLWKWVLLTSLTFLVFALVRTDFDDVDGYTGLSSLMNYFDSKQSKYVQNANLSFFLAIAFILATIAIDILLLVKSKRPPPVPENKDFV